MNEAVMNQLRWRGTGWSAGRNTRARIAAALAPLLSVLLSVLPGIAMAQAAGAGPPPALGGFDVYGSERIDVTALRIELRPTLDAFLAAMIGGDEAGVEDAAERIRAAIEVFGPFAATSFSMTQDFEPSPGYYLTVDVVETADAPRRMPFRETAADAVRDFDDPDGLIASWYAYQERFFALLPAGELSAINDANCPALHCLAPFDHPDLAPYLVRFDQGVAAHESELRAIVERDRDAGQRAAAVFLLAHTPDAARLLPLLGRAIYDPDSGVRNNAMRVMISVAQFHPELDFPIDSLIAAMDFPTASDRNKSAETVAVLAGQARYRAPIINGALDTCLKLIRLQLPNNRNPAHRILMTLSGLTLPADDSAGWAAWVREARDAGTP